MANELLGRRRCGLYQTSVVTYAQGLALQAEARRLVAGGLAGALLLLEHSPVITIGRGGGQENMLLDEAALRARGVDLSQTDRGGNITCHNPGQLVGYPILNLTNWREDVHWYVHGLEEVIIRTLAGYGLKAGRKADYTGVWLGDEKIAAIGVAVRRWITGHGFALNIGNDLALFETVVPCGISRFGVTSMAKAGVAAGVAAVAPTLAREFEAVFCCRLDAGIDGLEEVLRLHPNGEP